MKKSVIILSCILLSACSAQKQKAMVCTFEDSHGSQKIEIVYDSDEIVQKVNVETKHKLSDDVVEYYSQKEMEEQLDTLVNNDLAKGVSSEVSYNKENNVVDVKIDIAVDEMSDLEKQDYFEEGEDDLTAVTNMLVEDGYECEKVK